MFISPTDNTYEGGSGLIIYTTSGHTRKGTGTEQAHIHVHCRNGSMACFNYSKMEMNDLYVKSNFVPLCLENEGWRKRVTRCFWSLLSIQGKYINLIETSCALLSNHSLNSHMTHPCHDLYSSLTFITPFRNVSFPLPRQWMFQGLPSLVCNNQHSRELWGLPHQKVQDELYAQCLTPKSAEW